MRIYSHFAILIASMLLLSACGEADASKKHAADIKSDREEVAISLAHASEEAGDFPSAENIYKQAIEKNGNIKLRLELAEFYRRHNGTKQALHLLKESKKIEPNNTDIMRHIANIYILQAKPQDAADELEQAIELNPQDAFLYNSKGVALDMLGKHKEARELYKQAIEISPDDSMTFNANLAMSYILTEYYTKAINLLLPLANSPDSTPEIRQNLALAYGLKGDKENAEKFTKIDLPENLVAENIKFYDMLSVSKDKKSTEIKLPIIPDAKN